MPKLLIFDAFTLLIREKNVAIYALLRCKIFSLKIWVCKILDKFHVCGGAQLAAETPKAWGVRRSGWYWLDINCSFPLFSSSFQDQPLGDPDQGTLLCQIWRLAGVSINQAYWLEGQPSFVWGVIWMLYTNHTTDDWVRKGKNAVDILAFVSREGRWGLSACCAWTTSGGLSYWHCPGDLKIF